MESSDDEYKTDHIEETICKIGTPNNSDIDYDDSFLEVEDKKCLIACILEEIKNSPNYSWADDVMVKCVATYKYKQAINQINVVEYLKEKRELKKDPLLALK